MTYHTPGKLGMSPIRWANLNHSININGYRIMYNRQDVKWFSAIGQLSKISPIDLVPIGLYVSTG